MKAQRLHATTKGQWLALVACVVVLGGCAAERPVLYPTEKTQAASQTDVQAAIDECIALAKESDIGRNEAGDIAKNTAGGAVVGAAVGGAAGAVTGRAGRRAAQGAAGGAAGGFMRGLFRSHGLDPIEKRYVEQCLHERGYRTLGWK